MIRKFLFCVLTLFLFTSCVTCSNCNKQCVYVKAVPYQQLVAITKAPRPAPPTYFVIDDNLLLCDPENLRRLGHNLIELKRYTKDLEAVIEYYEKIVDEYNNENKRLENEAKINEENHNTSTDNQKIK